MFEKGEIDKKQAFMSAKNLMRQLFNILLSTFKGAVKGKHATSYYHCIR